MEIEIFFKKYMNDKHNIQIDNNDPILKQFPSVMNYIVTDPENRNMPKHACNIKAIAILRDIYLKKITNLDFLKVDNNNDKAENKEDFLNRVKEFEESRNFGVLPQPPVARMNTSFGLFGPLGQLLAATPGLGPPGIGPGHAPPLNEQTDGSLIMLQLAGHKTHHIIPTEELKRFSKVKILSASVHTQYIQPYIMIEINGFKHYMKYSKKCSSPYHIYSPIGPFGTLENNTSLNIIFHIQSKFTVKTIVDKKKIYLNKTNFNKYFEIDDDILISGISEKIKVLDSSSEYIEVDIRNATPISTVSTPPTIVNASHPIWLVIQCQ